MALIIDAKVNGKKEIAVIDTGYLGIILSKGFFDRNQFVKDRIIEFTLTSVESTIKKPQNIFERSRNWSNKLKSYITCISIRRITHWCSFRNKLDENRVVIRNKARLVVKGYN